MKRLTVLLLFVTLSTVISGCSGDHSDHEHEDHDEPHGEMGHAGAAEPEPVKGPNGGRLLVDDQFALELAIFQTGVPPEFRVWVTDRGQPVSPSDAEVRVVLKRLGNVENEIKFSPQGDHLRGDSVVYEPHSFEVVVSAQYGGNSYRWDYENFEGRTAIAPKIAESFGLETELAGPATIRETIKVYGQVKANRELVRDVAARFEGVIKSVGVSLGDQVKKGQSLAVVESNESLRSYTVTAPIDGVITERAANPGELTGSLPLFTIIDTRSVWAEFSIFPNDLTRAQLGNTVTVHSSQSEHSWPGVLTQLNSVADANQAVMGRVVLKNTNGALIPGMHITGNIEVGESNVPITVMRTGLQSFRDSTVVYAQVGDEYEVRMLDLGRQDSERVEVLEGLEAGTRYVTTNSYLVKADIEKSGATHDH